MNAERKRTIEQIQNQGHRWYLDTKLLTGHRRSRSLSNWVETRSKQRGIVICSVPTPFPWQLDARCLNRRLPEKYLGFVPVSYQIMIASRVGWTTLILCFWPSGVWQQVKVPITDRWRTTNFRYATSIARRAPC